MRISRKQDVAGFGPGRVPGACGFVVLALLVEVFAGCAGGVGPRGPASTRRLRADADAASVDATARGDAGNGRPDSSGRADSTLALQAARRVPREGCDPSIGAPADFRVDDTALVAARGTRTSAPGAAPTAGDAGAAVQDLTQIAHGHVRFAIPREWFAARDDGEGYTVYLVRTGDRRDDFGFYLGAAPPFRTPRGSSFALRLDGAPARGSVATTDDRNDLDALVSLPCAQPRLLYVWATSASRERFARMIDALRSVRVVREALALPSVVEVVASRDAPQVHQLADRDSLARELLDRAMNGDGLRAVYPIDTVHPLADQVLIGRFSLRLGTVPATVWVRVPVTGGHAHAPAVYGPTVDGTIAPRLAPLAGTGCRAPSVVFSHDAVAVRCEGEAETRVVIADANDALSFGAAVERYVGWRRLRSRWHRDPRVAGGWPDAACSLAATRLVEHGGAHFATSEHCVAIADARWQRVLAVAADGDCSSVPDAPWSRAMRAVGRFDEVRGAQRTFCHYALGSMGTFSWLIATGDEGTASGPVARGPVLGVDPRGVNTAVAFVAELVRYVAGQAQQPPSNVVPSVLRSLGADPPGGAGAVELLRLFLARGGLSGPATAAVLRARVIAPERIEVVMPALSIELVRERTNWLVAAARPTVFGTRPTLAPNATRAGAANATLPRPHGP